MNQKIELTRYVLEQLGMDYDDKSIKKILTFWWRNPRVIPRGGLGLTLEGFERFRQAGIKNYGIRLSKPIYVLTARQMLWIDQYIDCPFYLTDTEIIVFNEKMAVQLVLFSGNILRYGQIKSLRQTSS